MILSSVQPEISPLNGLKQMGSRALLICSLYEKQ